MSHESAVILIAAAFAVLGLAAACRRGLGWKCGAVMSASALVLCMAGARFFYIAVCDLTGAGFYGPLFPDDPYSYAFGGGVLGYVLSIWLTAKACRKPFESVANASVPVGLAAMAALRIAEALSDFGWGDLVDAAWMQRYPFAIPNMYGEWCAAVFNLEALCAIVILLVVLARKTNRLTTALIWWAATQIFCESLRVESIQWGFVRVQQLLSALTLAAVMLRATILLPKGGKKRAIPGWIALLAGCGAVIFLEYAIDKLPWATYVDYIAMAAVLAGMGISVQRVSGGKA